MEIDAATLKQVLRFQYLELTEALIYEKLAKREKNVQNRKVLQQIADDEVRHYEFWKEYSGQEVAPSRRRRLVPEECREFLLVDAFPRQLQQQF